MFFYILISSKNFRSLVFFLKMMQNIKVKKILRLKFYSTNQAKRTRSKLFSLLKSPHVNKTAQNQFQLFVFRQQVIVYTPYVFKFLVFLKKIKNLSFGVNVKIKIQFNFLKLTRKLKEILNPNNFYGLKYRIKFKQILKYFKVLDLYGELNFDLAKKFKKYVWIAQFG